MRTWKEFFKSLTQRPYGYSADGRMLGIGLDTALESSRQEPATDVEEFLRRRSNDSQRSTTAF